MTPEGATLMAQYNRWMNERMYEAAARLDHAQLTADKGAFFGSILATLNHIAVGDTIWLHRFAQYPASFSALAELSRFPRPSSLQQTIAADLPGLRVYRLELDEIIVNWAAELTPDVLASGLSYSNMAGVSMNKRFGAVLHHFFNHQTHHRGQVSTLLFQAGVDVGVTDLIAIIPDTEA